jgi:hypothetical protein
MRRLLIAALLVAIAIPSSTIVALPARALCFDVPGISNCITTAVFEQYWGINGGLPVFGYPITPERLEVNPDLGESFSTQWFERTRFEAHPDNRPPYHVLLGRLGAELLERQGRGIEPMPPGTTPSGRCRTFDVGNQKQFVCDPFLRYWETHGLEMDGRAGKTYAESLALFGLPLTTPRMETNLNGDTVRTQWFERARFEDHGSKGVLLGLLGREVLDTSRAGPVFPIVDGDSGFLIGGTRGGQWLGDAAAAPLLNGGERLRLYSLDGPVGSATGGAPTPFGPGPCPATIEVALQPKPAQENLIAVGGTWNTMPRPVTSLGTGSETYRAAVAEILRGNGISQPDVRIQQILRADLDGDGADEVLISANRLDQSGPGTNVAAGDYALVILRKVVGGSVRTIMIEEAYYPQAREFVGPNRFSIAGVLDLNGDNRMEVIVDSAYYEGAATLVYEVDNQSVKAVLGTGCGA